MFICIDIPLHVYVNNWRSNSKRMLALTTQRNVNIITCQLAKWILLSDKNPKYALIILFDYFAWRVGCIWVVVFVVVCVSVLLLSGLLKWDNIMILTRCSAFIIRIKYLVNSQFSVLFPDCMSTLLLFCGMLNCCKNIWRYIRRNQKP